MDNDAGPTGLIESVPIEIATVQEKEEEATGIFEVDFTKKPIVSGLKTIRHKGKHFYFEPAKILIRTSLELDLGLEASGLDFIKVLKKRSINVLPANAALFIAEKKLVSGELSGFYTIFPGTVFEGQKVLSMYWNDLSKKYIIRYVALKNVFGQFARIASYRY